MGALSSSWTDTDSYSSLLMSERFWRDMVPTENVLIFQVDSFIMGDK